MMGASPVRIRPGVRPNPTRRTTVVGLAVVTTALLLVGLPRAYAVEAPVGLGTAGTYSVLGGQTVTNTGPSTLSGDLGVSPGTAITGFPPGTVGGATHAGDAQAAQAQSDLVIAYDDTAGRAPTASVAGDLVGQTLNAGVYKSTGPLALSGTLTLDGQGNPNAVFIFQIASTLITASASNVNVINGAEACHVYWQVGTTATLGTTSSFKGTIMALTSVTVATGTVVEGRALARNGQVSLDNNTFTTPGCDNTPPVTRAPTTTASAADTVTSAEDTAAAAEDTATLSASGSGAEAVPSGSGEEGTSITGSFQLTPSGSLTSTVTASGNAETITAGHLHRGAAGTNGDVVVPLDSAAINSGSTATTQIDAVLAAEIIASPAGFYLDSHSSSFTAPTGNARGQLTAAAAAPGRINTGNGGQAAFAHNDSSVPTIIGGMLMILAVGGGVLFVQRRRAGGAASW